MVCTQEESYLLRNDFDVHARSRHTCSYSSQPLTVVEEISLLSVSSWIRGLGSHPETTNWFLAALTSRAWTALDPVARIPVCLCPWLS